MGTSLEDTITEAEPSLAFYHDVLPLDAPPDNETKANGFTKHKSLNSENRHKILDSAHTASTIPMEKISELERVAQIEEENEELPSKLILLAENLISEETTVPEVDDESKTFSTRSTLTIPPSLDTMPLNLSPSLDTKTWDMTLAGLQLVETIIGDATEADTRRKYNNSSCSQPRNLYQIERTPLHIDICSNDDESAVSSMSIEEEIFLGEGVGAASDRDRVYLSEEKPITKRLFGGKGSILRQWSLNRTTMQRANRRKPTPSTEALRSTVPVIKPTKSIDITAATIGTDEDDCYNSYYGEKVPFDEPHLCSPRLLTIEEIRIRK